MTEMKKPLFVCLAILLRISCSTFPQVNEDAGNRLSGMQIGISHMDLQEQSLNRAIHRGPGLMGAFYLERSNNKSLTLLNMELGSNFLRSNFESETSSYMFSGSVSFSHLRNLALKNPALSIQLGGKAKAGSAIEYFDNWDESHFYWISAYSLGADFRFTYSFGRNSRIGIEADFPILSLVSRSPSGFSNTQMSPALPDVFKALNRDLRFMTPGGYRNLNIQLRYSLRNPKKFIPAIFLRFNNLYVNKDGSAPMKFIHHTMGVEYRF